MRGTPNIAAMHLTTLKPDDRDVARNTHRPNKDPSSNHTREKFITNQHLGMASPFQLREWKSTRDSRVKLNPLPILHADDQHPETAASSPAGALAHWPCCHTSIKYRCVGPKDAQTVRLHPANGASTANVPTGTCSS